MFKDISDTTRLILFFSVISIISLSCAMLSFEGKNLISMQVFIILSSIFIFSIALGRLLNILFNHVFEDK